MEVRVSPGQSKVKEWLLDFIAGQRLGPGDRIPSERLLAESLNLSRPTVSKAITQLVESGVLSRGTGRSGTFVGGNATRRTNIRTRTIGMIMPRIRQENMGTIDFDRTASRYADHFMRENVSAEIMHGVLEALSDAGCRLVVHHNNGPEEEAEILSHLADEHLDGAVVMPLLFPCNMDLYTSLATIGPPVVFVDRYIPEAAVDSVVTDNFTGTKDAVANLIARGHRRIGFFTDFSDVSSIIDREAGYKAALNEANIPVDEHLICGPNVIRNNMWSFEYALHYCMHNPEPITAVFGINDDVVWAALQEANRLGLAIPGALELAGFFDALVPMGVQTSFLRVVQSKYKIGRIAAKLLLERICGEAPSEPRKILVPAELMLDRAE